MQAAAGSGRALSEGVAAQVKTVAGLTVDVYQQTVKRQLDRSIVLADAVPVGWVGELTRRNAAVIGELVAVYAGATHDLLQYPAGHDTGNGRGTPSAFPVPDPGSQ